MQTKPKRKPLRATSTLPGGTYVRLPDDLRQAVEDMGTGVTWAEKLRAAIAEWAIAKRLGPAHGGIINPIRPEDKAP